MDAIVADTDECLQRPTTRTIVDKLYSVYFHAKQVKIREHVAYLKKVIPKGEVK